MNYRDDYHDLPNERKDFFDEMCRHNDKYMEMTGKNCEQDFVDYRLEALAIAQSAFLMTVVWAQIANILIRKTQIGSIFTWKRFTQNRVMLYSIIAEIVIIVMIVYINGLNSVFLLEWCKPKWASTGLWILPFILGWDETRKWICRKYPKGWVAKYTNF